MKREHMIKEILRYLYIENLSPAETAQKMNISSERLKEMIQTMEHMGYVKTTYDEKSPACPGCRSCGGASTCHTVDSYMPERRIILTEKGQRMCNKMDH
ncbi:MAG: FeoC-like transcriptional regulator [Methanolobus sp.]|nr:FeoC-like transcriptional regulator [Methanolobus sp.]